MGKSGDNMNEDLKIIKKKYGEAMAHFCRANFSSLLEIEGLLPKLLMDHFAVSHYLYEDIRNQGLEVGFKNYIYSFTKFQSKEIKTDKTPYELLEEAGYILYECKTEKEIQRFKKYYQQEEQLCTFHGNRLERCFVFFAVKKNVEEIKREGYKNPERQDEYGTSVISIQFTKDENHTLSIKNRYNHTVANSDATFSNNLDNIIPGLTKSFEQIGLKQKTKNNGFELENYVCAKDGKFYKYNYEKNNIYYCPDNILIDNFEVKKLNPDRNLLLDYFVLDLQQKKLQLYDSNISDDFQKVIGKIQKIEIENGHENKKILFETETQSIIKVVVDSENRIIELRIPKLKNAGNHFLFHNKYLKYLCMPELEEVSDFFLAKNIAMKELEVPKLKKTGAYFLRDNEILKKIIAPELEEVSGLFLPCNLAMKELEVPKLKKVGFDFLSSNETLEKFVAPQLEEVGDNFLEHNLMLEELFLEKLKITGFNFLYYSQILKKFSAPELESVKNCFLGSNLVMEELVLEKLKKIGFYFLYGNKVIKKLIVPNLMKEDYLLLNLTLQNCILEQNHLKEKQEKREKREKRMLKTKY